jgi:hypothetical protein
MNTQFSTSLDEFKERLGVYKTEPERTIVENFGRVEEALKAEVIELCSWFADTDPDGSRFLIDPAKVPRTKARMLVRSMFACIEGIVYSMKQMALSANRLQGTLSPEEVLCCKEISFNMTDKGQMKEHPAKLRFLPNLQFAFAVLAKTFQVPFKLDTSCMDWKHMVLSVKLRDRLTHPKRPFDLELTDEELGLALKAYVWFDTQVEELLQQWGTRTEKTRDYLLAMSEAVSARFPEEARTVDNVRSDPTELQH